MARNKALFLLFIILLLCFFGAKSTFAQCNPGCGVGIPCSTTSLCGGCDFCGSSEGKNLGTLKGLGPLSDFINNLTRDNPSAATSMFTKIISNAVGIMTIVAVIWFIFTLLTGAISWLSSGGDKQKLQNAQKQITTGLVGLIIVISAIFLIKVIGVLFGFDILAISNLINNLWQTPTP